MSALPARRMTRSRTPEPGRPAAFRRTSLCRAHLPGWAAPSVRTAGRVRRDLRTTESDPAPPDRMGSDRNDRLLRGTDRKRSPTLEPDAGKISFSRLRHGFRADGRLRPADRIGDPARKRILVRGRGPGPPGAALPALRRRADPRRVRAFAPNRPDLADAAVPDHLGGFSGGVLRASPRTTAR